MDMLPSVAVDFGVAVKPFFKSAGAAVGAAQLLYVLTAFWAVAHTAVGGLSA